MSHNIFAGSADKWSGKEFIMGLARFMASVWGRGVRIVIGLVMIAIGLGKVGGASGWIIAIVGLLPLTLGIINGCILAPLLKVPFKGTKLPPA